LHTFPVKALSTRNSAEYVGSYLLSNHNTSITIDFRF
jgi:hypothetical protein